MNLTSKLATLAKLPKLHSKTDYQSPKVTVTKDLVPDCWVIKVHSGVIIHPTLNITLPRHTILASIVKKPSGYLLVTDGEKVTIHNSKLAAIKYYCEKRKYDWELSPRDR